jgi:Ca2+-binding RTX toxin-like protein
LDGGEGRDTASYAWSTGSVAANLADGAVRVLDPTGVEIALDTLVRVEDVIGGTGSDTLVGDDNDNRLDGEAGNDSIVAAGGSDTLAGGGGQDTLDGGDGLDVADFDGATDDLDVDLATGTESTSRSVLLAIEAVIGGAGDDTISGDARNNWLDGRGGDDSIAGLEGNDTLLGGPGDNSIDGGDGQDILRYDWATGDILVSLADGFAVVSDPAGGNPAAVDALSNVEHALGSAGNDTLIGSDVANFLLGGGGDDTLIGGAGNDTLFSGQGVDALDGGEGVDTADFSSATADLGIDLSAGTQSNGGTIAFVEGLVGGSGADSLTGDDAANWLYGNGGDDTLLGMDGADTLLGGSGDNLLDGMDGADIVDYSLATAAIDLNLGAGTASNGAGGTDTIRNVEHAVGSRFNDTVDGTGGDNFLHWRRGR